MANIQTMTTLNRKYTQNEARTTITDIDPNMTIRTDYTTDQQLIVKERVREDYKV